MAERTGSLVFMNLWSYVLEEVVYQVYKDGTLGVGESTTTGWEDVISIASTSPT